MHPDHARERTREWLRAEALRSAAQLLEGTGATAADVTSLAASLYAWLAESRLTLRVNSITYRQGTPPVPQPTIFLPGGTVQLTDIQQVPLSVEPEDSKGQPTSDTLTWTVDNPDVLSLQPSDDTLSALAVAGNPGTATVTVTDGALSATDAFVVTASATTQLVITEGAPEDQPPAA